jgi:hypothetical protein
MNRFPFPLAVVVLAAAATALVGQLHAQTAGIRPSAGVKDTVLRFYAAMHANDPAAFEEFISNDPALLVIGSADPEWYAQRERLRGVFRLGNQGLVPGNDAIAYEQGDMGWFIDRPDWIFADGSRAHMRFTAMLHRESSRWRMVQWHLSVGVPDNEVVGLQRRWLSK